MIRILLGALGILMFVACRREPPASDREPGAGSRPLIFLALGDSLTVGDGVPSSESFPFRLRARLEASGRTVDLRVRARSGVRARELNDAILRRSEALAPDIVTLCIGTNDVVQGRNRVEFESDFDDTVAWLRARHIAPGRVLVLSLPDWSRQSPAAAYGHPDELEQRFADFNDALERASIQAGLRWVDLRGTMAEGYREGLVAGDGLHPSGAAYERWASALEPIVEAALRDSAGFK